MRYSGTAEKAQSNAGKVSCAIAVIFTRLYLKEIFSEVTTQPNNGQISTFLLWKVSVLLSDQRPDTFKHVQWTLF